MFYIVLFEYLLISEKFSVNEFLASKQGSLGTLETVTWPCEPIILSVGHFESPTEVQLNSW